MCYDISLKAKNEHFLELIPELKSDWEDEELEELELTSGLTYPVYPVLVNEGNNYYLKKMEWGLIPASLNTPEKVKQFRKNMLNARSDRFINDPKSIWHKFRNQRCLIPVTGIFEHRHIHGWKNTIPYHVKQKDRDLFFLPGFYAYTGEKNPLTGDRRGTFVFLTHEANSLMAKIYNRDEKDPRMPLFLPSEAEMLWLDRQASEAQILEIANTNFPADHLESWPVYSIRKGRNFNGRRPDGLGASDPYKWPGLPELGNDRPVEQGSLF